MREFLMTPRVSQQIHSMLMTVSGISFVFDSENE